MADSEPADWKRFKYLYNLVECEMVRVFVTSPNAAPPAGFRLTKRQCIAIAALVADTICEYERLNVG